MVSKRSMVMIVMFLLLSIVTCAKIQEAHASEVRVDSTGVKEYMVIMSDTIKPAQIGIGWYARSPESLQLRIYWAMYIIGPAIHFVVSLPLTNDEVSQIEDQEYGTWLVLPEGETSGYFSSIYIISGPISGLPKEEVVELCLQKLMEMPFLKELTPTDSF